MCWVVGVNCLTPFSFRFCNRPSPRLSDSWTHADRVDGFQRGLTQLQLGILHNIPHDVDDHLPSRSMTANDCTALSFVDSSNFSGRLCHNATHGRTILRMADDSEYSVLMRVSGPHPQTKLFERAESQDWIADFQLCAPGLYGASILLISSSAVDPYVVRKAGPSVGPSRAACPQFHAARHATAQSTHLATISRISEARVVSILRRPLALARARPPRL